jgi:hypothetical protein
MLARGYRTVADEDIILKLLEYKSENADVKKLQDELSRHEIDKILNPKEEPKENELLSQLSLVKSQRDAIAGLHLATHLAEDLDLTSELRRLTRRLQDEVSLTTLNRFVLRRLS